jgi:AcrR family transcriptional regulator
MMFERDGFDAVSIAQVAAEAEVAKMTVTNYFARKEDLVFDRADFVIGELARTVAGRPAGQTPLEAARAAFLAAVRARSPMAGFARASFARMVDGSPVLTARYREMMDLRDRRLADQLRDEFALPDAIAQFHAAQLGSVVRIVTGEARRRLIEGMSLDDLQVFLEVAGGGCSACSRARWATSGRRIASDRADDPLALSFVLGLGQQPLIPEGLQPGQPFGRGAFMSGACPQRGDGVGPAPAEQGAKHLTGGVAAEVLDAAAGNRHSQAGDARLGSGEP